MKILQIIPNLSGGGAERFVVDLCNELVKQHEVFLISLYSAKDEDVFRKDLASSISTFSLDKTTGFDKRITRKLYRVIVKINPDIIHTHLRSYNYLMPLIPFLKKRSIVHTVHNDAIKECPNKKIRKIRELSFKLKNIVPVTISEESAKSFRRLYPYTEDHLIYNGRNYPRKSKDYSLVLKELEGFKRNVETKIFVNIGRMEKQKNQLMLCKAFHRLIKEDEANAILLIIGGGRNSNESREIQAKLEEAEQENDYIHLLGEKNNATDYLHATNFFAMSSIFEGMPITLIEAFATGCIPVCTPVGGIPEMINELETSLLSKSSDVDDYYQALKKAYEMSEDQESQIRQHGRHLFVKKYAMELCAREYEKLYTDLMEKK